MERLMSEILVTFSHLFNLTGAFYNIGISNAIDPGTQCFGSESAIFYRPWIRILIKMADSDPHP